MQIPKRGREGFVRDIVDQCLISQRDRADRGMMFQNYALFGSSNAEEAAMYNKTFAYLDDLESLLYSPVSLRFTCTDPDVPNVVNEAKGRAAASKLRALARRSETDTKISQAVFWSLVKGKALIKQLYNRGQFSPHLVQPESFGVLRENHDKLDEDMEAFTHSMLITRYQFERLIWDHPDKKDLMRKAKNYMRSDRSALMSDNPQKQIVVGGLYPFQPQGSGTPNNTRGIVDWMGGPAPVISPQQLSELMQLDELWVWDNERRDWATFQQIGDDILISGKYTTRNSFAYDKKSGTENENLAGHHPFIDFCPNHLDGYFWGRSEVVNIALLQEAINSRINGTNRLLRMQEDPPKRFIGSTGVNQSALAKFNKPGGYWSDSNPNAKVDEMAPNLPQDLWASLQEYERMFDEMGGLPPIAKGRGESGVRSGSHADTLVRMFSPRFKDRALIVERDVEALGGLMLDMSKAHIDKRLIAWVSEDQAGLEGEKPDPLLIPPVKGQVPVFFTFADLTDDMVLTVDSHSSSPAFAQDAQKLAFDLYKIGAMAADNVVDHVDAPDPEGLVAGIQRREQSENAQQQQEQRLKLVGKKK